MNIIKKLGIVFGVAVLVIIIAGIYKFNFTNSDIFVENETKVNIHDGTYDIGGQKITLMNGVSESSVTPGSASKIITRYFGNEVKGDFDGNGVEDVAFLVTQEMGGSGTFFYVTALLNGKIGVPGVLLGDRIAPQTMNIQNGNILVVNYVDRNPGESFAVRPSLGKSLYLKLNPKTVQFGEVVQNFEGEADPSRMTLGMTTWRWVRTTYNNDTEVLPHTENKFTLTFKNDKTFSATTDCNGMGGEYTVAGNKITFGKMMSTLMYCEGSQESDFAKMLTETQTFLFTGKGELVLGLKNDGGSMVFR
jgi:heat shock protein HslJ